MFGIAPAGFALPSAVQREVAVATGGHVILAGGLDPAGNSTSGVFSLNVHTGHLATLGSLPNAFHDGAGAMIGTKLFVFGGGVSEGTDVVQSFDLSTNTAAAAGHMPVALSDLAAASVNGTVYLIGGWDGHNYNATIYSTTDGTDFSTVGPLPQGLRYPAVAVSGSVIVIAGGEAASGPVDTVYAFDTTSGKVVQVAKLPSAVGHASAFTLGGKVYVAGGLDKSGHATNLVSAVASATGQVTRLPGLPASEAFSDAGTAYAGGRAWIVGGTNGTAALTQVLMARFTVQASGPSPSVAASIGPQPTKTWPIATSGSAAVRPFAGLLLIADRGVNKLLVVNAKKQVVWQFPNPGTTAPIPFYFPDDGFWVHGGHAILVNEEENNMLAEISYPSGKKIWTYGHPGIAGAAPGYLHQPDDAYPYLNGGVVVADAKNCRILFFNSSGRATNQIGKTGNCKPNLPTTVGWPNGDTALPNGNLLVSELNGGAVSEVTPTGSLIWQVHLPGVTVPSDPQQLADGSFLVVNYHTPGRIVRFTSTGKVLWNYYVKSGPGELNHPSLAVPLPNGLVAVNDDYNDRVIIIDPATNKIVWQYGVKGVSGSSPPYLNTPDGIDLLFPDGTMPLHLDLPGAPTPGGP